MNTTYIPQPLDTGGIELTPELMELIERIAAHVHETWAAGRIADGWQYGKIRNDERKEHPCLVPYLELPEIEKEYDRKTAIETLKAAGMLGFRVTKT